MRYTITAIIIFLSSLLISSPAFATATLRIGFGAGSVCDTECGDHPNVSPSGGSDTFSIYQNSGGADDITDDIWFIIGVPDIDDPNYFDSSDITGVTSYNPYPGGTTVMYDSSDYGQFGTDGTDGYMGNLDPGEEVYGDVLGLYNPEYSLNNSNNFNNWQYYDLLLNGIDAEYFGIYVFLLEADLYSNGLIDIYFQDENTVPTGSYIIAYGHGSDYGVPFTRAGLQVPEPSTLILLGSGLVGLGLMRRKLKV